MASERPSWRGGSAAVRRRESLSAALARPAAVRPAQRLRPQGLALRAREAATLAPPATAPLTGPPLERDATVIGRPIDHPADPRWVLAVRTAEELQGPILPPERRERLLRLGKLMGLSPFDANLVIAIVQDQARRGYAPAHCPAAGEAQLRMVPLTAVARLGGAARRRRALTTAWIIIAVIALELLLLRWLLG